MIERAIEQLARLRPLQRERIVAIAPTSAALRAARTAGVRPIAVGAPAHVAVDADGAVAGVDGLMLGDLARLCGIARMERRS
jgi:beta-phosphoglucomutase-like phosphatase (HAD superfamily)